MDGKEFWEGYHSYKNRKSIEDCPYRWQPGAAKEWKRGYRTAVAELG